MRWGWQPCPSGSLPGGPTSFWDSSSETKSLSGLPLSGADVGAVMPSAMSITAFTWYHISQHVIRPAAVDSSSNLTRGIPNQ